LVERARVVARARRCVRFGSNTASNLSMARISSWSRFHNGSVTVRRMRLAVVLGMAAPVGVVHL
jgi:hypothetical protein